MVRRARQPPPRPDILHLAQDNLGTADQVIVFGALFDAAIRSTWTMGLDDPRLKVVLNEALDRIYAELTRTTPAQVQRAPGVVTSRAGGRRIQAPALRP